MHVLSGMPYERWTNLRNALSSAETSSWRTGPTARTTTWNDAGDVKPLYALGRKQGKIRERAHNVENEVPGKELLLEKAAGVGRKSSARFCDDISFLLHFE